MKHTQFLIFESNRDCNLGSAHAKCPNKNPERCRHCDTTRPLSDQQIVDAVARAYDVLGFEGYVGYHYYNEPLLATERILPLCRKIRKATPKARFVLWTNGTKLPPPGPDLEQLREFSLAWLTQYDNGDYRRIKTVIPKTTIVKWQLDNRTAQPMDKDSFAPCARPFSEMVFDYYGNMHLCCIDWRGEAQLGNLHDTPIDDLAAKFIGIRDCIAGPKMMPHAPAVCRRCVGRHAHIAALVPDIMAKSKAYVQGMPARRAVAPATVITPAQSSATGALGVVLVSYRVPVERLRDHFRWNDATYSRSGARVFAVVDRICPDLPRYVRQLVVDDPMPVFNLSKTKNIGIRHAIESGCSRVIATDVDVAYSDEAWSALCGVTTGRAIVPTYRMASCYDRRATDFVFAPKATGTVSMVADDWRRAHYHEGCVGYGCDDAIILRSAEKQGIHIDRAGTAELWHIAHVAGTPQKEFDKARPRTDHWGRDNGFNHENFAGNHKYYADPIYRSERWGLTDSVGLMTMVMTHYRMPDQRLLDCLAWNREAWKAIGARVIVVSDRSSYDAQDHFSERVRVARYPIELQKFSLAQTSNFGIRLAGGGIIVKTDPDILWPIESAQRAAAVTDVMGWCPKYRMAEEPSAPAIERAQIWDASKGTLALTYAHWDAISGYDERMIGYGIEDGDAYHRAGCGCRPARDAERTGHVVHVAHSSGPQGGGHMRHDCWGRDSGFNAKMHHQNMTVRREPWHSKTWGII